MKKIVLVVLLAGWIFGGYAQEVKFGVKAGMNMTSLGSDFKDALEGFDQKTKIGFHIGAFVDLGITENFYIQPGLYYSNKGAKFEAKENSDYKVKVNLSYLEIPILASYRFRLSDNMKLHINTGPYLAYGLGGKFKFEPSELEEAMDGDVKAFDEDEGDLKRFDFGWSFGAGVNFSAVYVGLKYDLGFSNIAGDSYDEVDVKIHNRNFSVSVGYTF